MVNAYKELGIQDLKNRKEKDGKKLADVEVKNAYEALEKQIKILPEEMQEEKKESLHDAYLAIMSEADRDKYDTILINTSKKERQISTIELSSQKLSKLVKDMPKLKGELRKNIKTEEFTKSVQFTPIIKGKFVNNEDYLKEKSDRDISER